MAEERRKRSIFDKFAHWASHASGRPIAFVFAVLLILVWAVTGPMYKFNETWQLVINTTTTIITFLMVFLIQSTQNRDTAAIHIKLDELIRSTQGAHNALLDLEELSEEELTNIRANYERLAGDARDGLRNGVEDSGSPEVGQRTAAPGAKAGA